MQSRFWPHLPVVGISFVSASRMSLCTDTSYCPVSCTHLPESREITEQAEQNHQKRIASGKIWSVEELETLPAETRPRTPYQRPPDGGDGPQERNAAVGGWPCRGRTGPWSFSPVLELIQRQHWENFLWHQFKRFWRCTGVLFLFLNFLWHQFKRFWRCTAVLFTPPLFFLFKINESF